MALKPEDNLPARKEDRTKDFQEEALLREVDEAVRNDNFSNFFQTYGKVVIGLIVAGLAVFAVSLWWKDHNESQLEKSSEELVKALDQIDAGNLGTAEASLKALADGDNEGTAIMARLLQAGIALSDNRKAEATAIYDAVAADESVSQPLRDLATLRSVGANYDQMEPQAVIDRLQPLAKPGNAFFPSAGEMVAMAYLDQGKEELAGPIFAEISRDKNAPASIQSRARQMAGLLGVDAVDDIDEAIDSIAQEAPVAEQ